MPKIKSQLKGWREMKLGDIVSINSDSIGKNFPFEQILYTDISSVGTGVADDPAEIFFSKAPSRARRLLKDGDTILSTVRPNRRSFLYMKNPKENRVVSTGFAVIRASNKIDSRFLYYLISNQPFTDYLALYAKGAAYPAIDKDIIADANVVVPEIKTQKQIADILLIYDNLIENNTKRIKILEKIAQAIYKEWFVYFRFPGHEKIKMVDSKTAFGKIPRGGWRIERLEDLVENLRISTSAGEHLKFRKYVPIDCIDSARLTLIKYEPSDSAKSSLILFEKGDILFGAMRPYFHKVAIAPFSGVTRTMLVAFQKSQKWRQWRCLKKVKGAILHQTNSSRENLLYKESLVFDM